MKLPGHPCSGSSGSAVAGQIRWSELLVLISLGNFYLTNFAYECYRTLRTMESDGTAADYNLINRFDEF